MDGSPLVKVLDFGISKINDVRSGDAPSLTVTGTVMGSPAYMSPEQVRNAKSVDARSDIWALGVIAYEVLAGVSPFSGETIGEVFAKIVSEPPPPLILRRPDLPEGVIKAVARCLERDLERRTPTVAAFVTELEPFAPPESRVSVDRIVRVSGGGSRPPASRTATLFATETMGAPSGTEAPVGTAPPWLTSGARLEQLERRRGEGGRRPIALTAVAVIAVVGALGLAISVLRPRVSSDPGPSAGTGQVRGEAPTASIVLAPSAPAAAAVAPVVIANPVPVATEAPSASAAAGPPNRASLPAASKARVGAPGAPHATPPKPSEPSLPATPRDDEPSAATTESDPFSGLKRK